MNLKKGNMEVQLIANSATNFDLGSATNAKK